jgi:histidinol-phosphate aminotransferase
MALVPSYIQRLANYKPGKPIAEAQRELGIQNFIKLASNENPLGSSPKGLAAIEHSLTNLRWHRDSDGDF